MLEADLDAALQVDYRERFGAVCSALNPIWIEEALLSTGSASIRKRRFPAEMVVFLVIGMALMRNRSIEQVLDILDLKMPGDPRPVAKSAIVQARQRLGDQSLAWLFSRSADVWAHRRAKEQHWRGLAVYGLDGTSMAVADSTLNRDYFGGPGSGRGVSGYPMVRLVTLMALRSHLLAAAAFGPLEFGELNLAGELWQHIPDDSLSVVDKGFFAANALIPLTLSGTNRHWLTRSKVNTVWRVVEHLGPGDDLVEMDVSSQAHDKCPGLPKTWRARAIRYQRDGFPAESLLTSLLDSKAYPGKEIVRLYHERWELELAFDNVKTEILERKEALRSQAPQGVSQELFGILLTYNLVRLEMDRVAKLAGVSPLRISFVWAFRMIRDEWMFSAMARSQGAIPKQWDLLARQIARFLLPERRERVVPRGVKVKMSGYPRLRPGDRAAARSRRGQ